METKMTVEEALRILLYEEYLEDWIYDIRDRARENDGMFEGNSWEHPRVKRFEEICKVLKANFPKRP
jgi:hypothetical protein